MQKIVLCFHKKQEEYPLSPTHTLFFFSCPGDFSSRDRETQAAASQLQCCNVTATLSSCNLFCWTWVLREVGMSGASMIDFLPSLQGMVVLCPKLTGNNAVPRQSSASKSLSLKKKKIFSCGGRSPGLGCRFRGSQGPKVLSKNQF